ncbi:diguanylate cyclase [Bacillus cereus group sp. N12]|uniref:diguanylate cyclase n=1 Tax=Bacillus cereus group TaxID=86661 RepID=UPI0015CF5049|nr:MULTISPECIES: diguanylate cyclase [Bacillus cereus group]MBJ8078163.1 diguanylate cyclase [Bacillus cereus group sp. N12]
MYSKIRNYNDLMIDMEKVFKQIKSSTIVLIDLDHFHKNKIEHEEDKLIETIYNFFIENLAINCHYLGKDEFCIIFEGMSLENVIGKIFEIKSLFLNTMNMTFSASIAEYPKHGEDYVEILRNLEESLFQSKQNGRNNISIVDVPKMKLKSNYYSPIQLSRLNNLSKKLNRSEASLLRESLDEIIRKYEL